MSGFIIYDPAPPSAADHHRNGGYACKTPIEGWVFTILRKNATVFPTREKAEATVKQHYRSDSSLIIAEV